VVLTPAFGWSQSETVALRDFVPHWDRLTP
jgi:hypothetical protein